MIKLNSLYTMDCFEFLAQIEDNTIDAVITDPPYCIKYKEWDRDEFNSFTSRWVEEIFRVLKPTGTLWSFMGYTNIFDFAPILNKYGIVHLENWVVWARQKGRGSSRHLKSQREDIFHATKTNQYTWNSLKMLREVVTPYVKDGKPRGWFINEEGKRVRWTGLGNVWVYTAPYWNSREDLKTIHPAQKPIMLMERLILLSSNLGDTICDPFVGSGATVVAAKKHGRNFIGCDNNLAFIEIANDRLQKVGGLIG